MGKGFLIGISPKHIKRISTSLVTREVQMKMKMRYHFTLLDWLKQKRQTITRVGDDAEKLDPSYSAGGI